MLYCPRSRNCVSPRPWPFERDQANRQAGSVKLQNYRRQRAWWQPAQISQRQIRDAAEIGVRIGPWLKIDFDQTDAGQGSRFDVINSATQRKESFEGISDVGLNLLRWHAGIKCRHNDDRNINWREQIHGHSAQSDGSDDGDHQTQNDDEERILDGEAGH